MSRLTSELDDAIEQRTARGLRRERRIVDSAQGARLRVDGREVLHFGSNDYLGLAGERRVVAAAQEGAARYGVGAGASHLISGHFAICGEPGRRAHLFALIDSWREAAAALPWQTLPSTTAIQPLILGANADALRISDALWKRDIWVPAIRPPTVPRGSARLRITFFASHTIDNVDRLAEALSDVAR